MRQLIIDNHIINDESDCYVIAEIGSNHCGDLDICKQLFKEAKVCGCSAVKLQKRANRKLFTKAMYNSLYDNPNSYGKTYGEHREALEFGRDEYVALKQYAKEIGITFFATAFDIKSADFLAELDMPAYKTASWDLLNIPLIEHIMKFGKPMILSTGGADSYNINRVCMWLKCNKGNCALLHCIASYPCQAEDINLRAIVSLRNLYPSIIIGFSDHYNGIVMAEASYMMGARIIEKHFTLNHTWKGTDHALSLEPQGMRRLCRDLKRLKVAMGDGEKRKLPCEEKAIWKMGNAVHVTRPLPGGAKVGEEDIALMAPADGIPPYELENVMGKITICDISTNDVLDWNMLKGE